MVMAGGLLLAAACTSPARSRPAAAGATGGVTATSAPSPAAAPLVPTPSPSSTGADAALVAGQAAQMAALVGSLSDQLTVAERPQNQAAQDRWLAYRNAWCPVAVAATGSAPTACQLSEAARRIAALNVLLGSLGAAPGGSPSTAVPTPSPPDALDTCLNNGSTSAALAACIRTATGPLNEQIVTLDAALAARLGPAQRPQVSAAQSAWAAYRDAWCALSASALAPAAGQALALGLCTVRADQQRISELSF